MPFRFDFLFFARGKFIRSFKWIYCRVFFILYIVVEPTIEASASKSLFGKIRFPSGKNEKQIKVRISSYGQGVNEYFLK